MTGDQCPKEIEVNDSKREISNVEGFPNDSHSLMLIISIVCIYRKNAIEDIKEKQRQKKRDIHKEKEIEDRNENNIAIMKRMKEI